MKVNEALHRKVYIVGGDHLIEQMFASRGVFATDDILDADFLCFTGGHDVTPSLYGEKNVASQNDWLRDVNEQIAFEEAIERGLPCVGICRGGQFLNVMCGGKMFQDVDNHAIYGTHEIFVDDHGGPDGVYGRHQVTSTHHQMMRQGPDGEVIGFAELATRFIHDGDDPKPDFDTEVVWYAEKKCLCFQPHPEYNGKKDDTEQLFFDLLKRYEFI